MNDMGNWQECKEWTDTTGKYATEKLELTEDEFNTIMDEMNKAVIQLSSHPDLQRIFKPGRYTESPVSFTVRRYARVGVEPHE